MSEFQIKDQTGYLFKNKYKTADNHPTYKGTAKVNGMDKEIAAWVATGASGDKYLSIRFSDPRDNIPNADGTFGKKKDELDDEIPF